MQSVTLVKVMLYFLPSLPNEELRNNSSIKDTRLHLLPAKSLNRHVFGIIM